MKKAQLINTIDDVFAACGLCNYTRHSKTPIPWKKGVRRIAGGYELHMKFPLGKCLADVQNAYDPIVVALDGADIRLGTKGGWLVLQVYSEPLPSFIPFSSDLLAATYHTWKVPLIYTQEGIIFHDFKVWPHLKIGGATRKGKSVAIKGIVTTLLHNHTPEEIQLVLLDGKKFVTFAKYDKFPHIFAKGWDVKSAFDALERTATKLDQRMEELKKHDVEDANEYEEIFGTQLTRYFVIVDEGFEFRVKDAKTPEDKAMRQSIESRLEELASLGAGPGFHLIYCTQRPDAETIPPLVRANIEACLAFRVTNTKNSEVLLDNQAAYKLPDIRGRAIYQTDKTIVGQVPFLGNLRGWWLLFELSNMFNKVTKSQDLQEVDWVDVKQKEKEYV